MSALQQNSTNISFLSPFEFKLTVAKLPTTNFYIQTANVPSLSLPSAKQSTPFVRIPLIGDQIEYNPLRVTFKVDSQMTNYMEIYNWLLGIGKPWSFDQAKTIGASTVRGQQLKELNNQGRYSDGILTILDGQRTPIINVHLKSLLPVALGELIMDSTKTSVDYVTGSATFEYESFEIEKLNA